MLKEIRSACDPCESRVVYFTDGEPMQASQKFSPRLNALAVAAALCLLSAAASAGTVVTSMQATGSYALGSDAAVSLLDSKTSPASGASVDVLSFPFSGSNSAGLHSYGYTGGNFGSRSSGQGVYDVSGSFKIVMTISNTTLVAQTARFDFNITPGLLSNSIASPLIGSEFLNAAMKFDIRRNGTTLWGSAATLNSNAVGTSFSASGDTSLYVGSGAHYTVANVSKSIDLGVLNAGESIQLSYQLDSFAKGSSAAGIDRVVPDTEYYVPDQWVDECTISEGYGSAPSAYGAPCTFGTLIFIPGHTVKVPGYTVLGAAGGSHASSGDPFDVDLDGNIVSDPTALRSDASRFGASVTLTAVPVGAIPEPETYALMLGGLAVVGWMARRRRSVAAA
jgi:PEP-CTERM motif